MPDTRWKQRFQNFENALLLLRDALESKPLVEYSDLEKEGIVQRFEYTFELAWKTLKDYLEYTGIQLPQVTPRQTIKEAFSAKIIQDGQTWIEMLECRNLMSHVYSQKTFTKTITQIQSNYLSALDQVYTLLKEKNGE